MGADFYSDDYGGDYYDYYGGGGGGVAMESNGAGGGGYDWGFDTTSWPTFEEYYGGGGLPPDYGPIADQAWMVDPITGFMDMGGGYLYDPGTGGILDTGLQQGAGSDLFGAYFDYYSAQGYDDYTAMQMADEQARAGSILTETLERGAPPVLPDLPQYFPLPYVTPYDYWQSPPYIPDFGRDGEFFPLPLPPDTTQPNLPPYCPQGQYHPYPIGHPQQNVCVPFPPATTNQPQRPQGQQGGGAPSPAPKPPSQQQPKPQQCPQGYYRAPNGQCLPIPRCTSPGTVYDQRSGRCIPSGQASAPGCPPGEWFNPQTQKCEVAPTCSTPGTVFDVNRGMCVPADQLSSAEDIFGGLKNVPWWVWAAAGVLFLVGSNDSGGRTTTVRYRRGA